MLYVYGGNLRKRLYIMCGHTQRDSICDPQYWCTDAVEYSEHFFGLYID